MDLTDDMRDWIRTYPPTSLLFDFVMHFQVRYGLTPEQAGRLLAQWIKECC